MHLVRITNFILIAYGLLYCSRAEETSEIAVDPIPLKAITSKGTIIDHQVCGDGDITLLFIHGWCIDQTYWSYQIDGFCSNYKIVTIDLPGFGNSGRDRNKWTIEQYGKDVNTVIDQLALENVVLVGHSMGGDVILEAALANEKVIALVGVDNFKDISLEFDQQLRQEIAGFLEVLGDNFQEVASAYAEGVLFHAETDSMVIKRVVNDIVNTDSIIAVASLKSLFDYTQKESKRLSELEKKLYLINSSNTTTDTVALTSTGVSFKLLEINGTGHYPMIEKPGVFNQQLKLVLQDIEAKM
jgi:pimeloyl-ACP methyl ester carboxylesterase